MELLLRKFIAHLASQIASVGDTKEPSVTAPPEAANMKMTSDVKKLIGDRQTQEDELVSGILESLGNIRIG